MKKLLLLTLCISTISSYAQIPEDVIRYTWQPFNGSTRIMSVGGVTGSLGGDISSIYGNPAGIAFYNTREVVFGLNFLNQKTKADFRDESQTTKNNTLLLNPVGFVVGLGTDGYNKSEKSTFALAMHQTASFNKKFSFGGLNNYSSYSESMAEAFALSGLSIDDVLQTNSPMPYTAAPGLYTYLIDTVLQPDGSYIVRGAPENILDAGQAIRQQFDYKSTGGMYELAGTFAVNKNDRWFFGGTIGIPFIRYSSTTSVSEKDTSDAANGFASFHYEDKFQTTGVGLNLKLGAIYRPKEYIRLGVAIHSPTFMYLTDKRSAELRTDLDGSTYSVSSNLFTLGKRGEASYYQNTAWKAMISGSYVFREVQETRKQKGFISADIEYVNHRGSRFSSANEEVTSDEKKYYKDLGKVVKEQYKGAFNFRVGGELKFNTIMARAGFGYYGNPYKNSPDNAYQMQLAAGIGYRDKGIFIDLGYVHHIVKDHQFPYRLVDRLNTYAGVKNTRGQIMATFGIKI